MELHNLSPAKGATKNRKRIARGEGSGKGGTSTRGHKGQQSRSGYKRKRNHEGGQMPLQMRLPKFGFNSPNRKAYFGINLDQLQAFAQKHGVKEITLEILQQAKYIKKRDRVKILGRGEITDVVRVEAHAVTTSAKAAIEAKGGSVTIVQ
jgi:large subunit ribosomal protein L15